MNPLDALGNFAVGLIKAGRLQGWCKLIASCSVTAFVAFFGTLGLSIITQVESGVASSLALVLGIAHASIAMSVAVLSLWLRSGMTKGIPILYPGRIEAARLDSLKDGGVVFNPNAKR